MTQNEAIIEYMKKHKKGITPMEALNICGCFRLSGRIFELRKQGYDIKTDMVAVRTVGGDTKYVARYSLE